MTERVYDGVSLADYAEHKKKHGKNYKLFVELDDILAKGAPKHAKNVTLTAEKVVNTKPQVKIERAVKNPVLGANK